MIWFFQDVARSKLERRELEQLVGSVDWLVPLGWKFDSTRLAWDADILVGERVYPITLRYPNHFPYSPPLVLPREDTSWWSSHQYGAGGELCLEYGPDNWHQDITGAEMVRSAYRLLLGENDFSAGGSALPSRHRSSVAEQIGGKRRRFFLDVDAQGVLIGLVDDQLITATIVIEYSSNASVRFLASAKTGDTDWKGKVPPAILKMAYERPAVLLRWPEAEDRPLADSARRLREAVAGRGMDPGTADHIVLIQGSTVLAFQADDEDDSVVELSVILEEERRTRLAAGHETLIQRKVAIAGCGSMGSKIAAILARSGVGRFVLIDTDIFLPENLVRNDLDWRDVGVHKVDAVANRIGLINPAANAIRYRRDLGGQGSSSGVEGLIEVLEECDLLIDATASTAAFEVLSSVRGFAQRPMVWGEVFAGGIGGFIARSRHDSEPNPMTIRRTIESWCAENGRVISPAPAPYEGGEDVPFIAGDAEVSIIASHLAAFAIDTLIPRIPSSYLHSVYLIGLQAEWIFDQAFEVRPITVGPPGDDAPVNIDTEALRDEIVELGRLLKEHPDANTPES
jgi:sulfur-carrier protein adenylyltransferase/sulfurtransferase